MFLRKAWFRSRAYVLRAGDVRQTQQDFPPLVASERLWAPELECDIAALNLARLQMPQFCALCELQMYADQASIYAERIGNVATDLDNAQIARRNSSSRGYRRRGAGFVGRRWQRAGYQ